MPGSQGGEHQDEEVALEQVVLELVAGELVAVRHHGGGHVSHLEALLPATEAQLGVLVVGEELLGEPAQRVPGGPPHHQRGAAGGGDGFGLGMVGSRLLEPARPAHAEEVHVVAGRVEQVRSIGQPHAGGGDPDPGAVERPGQLGQGGGLDDGVGVDQRHERQPGGGRATVAAGGEAHVAARVDDRHAGQVGQGLDHAVGPAVVHQHHLGGDALRRQDGLHRPPQPRLGAVSHDHRRDPVAGGGRRGSGRVGRWRRWGSGRVGGVGGGHGRDTLVDAPW